VLYFRNINNPYEIGELGGIEMRKFLLILLILPIFAGVILASDYISNSEFISAESYVFEQMTLKSTDSSVMIGIASKPILLTFVGELLTYKFNNSLQYFADTLVELNSSPNLYVLLGLKDSISNPVVLVKIGVRKYLSLKNELIGNYNDYAIWLCTVPLSESNYYKTVVQVLSDSQLYFIPMDEKTGNLLAPELGPITYQQLIQNQD